MVNQMKPSVTLVGKLNDPLYQKCKKSAEVSAPAS
jgi:hypothetical protein